jgi:hypothetical protein
MCFQAAPLLILMEDVSFDEIPLKFLKLILLEIISPIAHIFNKTFSSKTFPSARSRL